MKILKPSAYYEPEVFSSAHLNNDLEKALVENGDEIYIVTPQPSRGCTEEDYIKYKPREQKYDGHVNIERFKLMKEGKNVLKRAFRYIYMNFEQYLICSKYKDIDLIYAASTPPTQGALAALLKKRLKKPFVYNLQDVFPDSMVNAKMTKKGSLIWKIGRIVEDFTYRNADKIIVISQDIKKNLINKGVPENKIKVIYNWIDTKRVRPVSIEKNRLAKKFGITEDTFNVVYAGSIGALQGIETIINAAELLKKENVAFHLFGDGVNKVNIEEKARGLNNVYFYPLQSLEYVSEVYSLGNCCIVSCKEGTGQAGLPSKTWSILACGRPIILSFDYGELSELIVNNGLGMYSKAGDAKTLANNIRYYLQNKEICKEQGRNAREFAIKVLDKNKSMSLYIELFKELL